MNEKMISTIVIGAIGTLLIFARRWKNKDKDAGLGIAGWTIVLLFCIWVA